MDKDLSAVRVAAICILLSATSSFATTYVVPSDVAFLAHEHRD